MKFDKVENVETVVEGLRRAEISRSYNRALVNDLFNGNPPFTENEAEQNHINTNVNFLDAPRIAHEARNTFNNAFLKPGNFFSATTDSGPTHKRSTWGRQFTKNINRIMKKSKKYLGTLRDEFAQTTLHGVGPSAWDHTKGWCPVSVFIGDLWVPSKTRVAMDNLDYFSIHREYTPFQFQKMATGSDSGWNKKMVNKVLKNIAKSELVPENSGEITYSPEKIAELFKEDAGLLDSESIPTIKAHDFYFRNDDDGKYYRRMLLDDSGDKDLQADFIYKPKGAYADELCHILHVMFADGANVAPFRYHSVRGLGWLLYAVCHLQNRLRCKFNDAVFEQMLWYFRVNSPEDRERLDMVDLHHLGIIPDGLSWVPASERYKIDQNLVQAAFSLNNQSMAESSAMFRQGINGGEDKVMTAQEAMARVNAANALVGAMLNLAYTYQTHQYQEIVRRFCLKSSIDEDVKKFRAQCLKDGIPEEMLDVERWNIEPERVLGAGNKTLEIAQAQRLMEFRNLFDPEPQREILHIFTEAVTDDPDMASRLVPIKEKVISDSVHDAQLSAAALMMGLPVSMKTGMNHIEYVEALLISMGSIIKRIEGTTKMADLQEIVGFENMAKHISEHIEVIAQDRGEKARVKNYGDALGKFMNLVKAYAQRYFEQNSQGNALTPEAQAKIQSSIILATAQAKIKEASASQRRQQRDADFMAAQKRDEERHRLEMGKMVEQTQVENVAKDLETSANIARQINGTTE